MAPLLWVLGFALFFTLIGWTWSELPRPQTLFVPTWTRSYQLYGQPHAVWLDRYDKPGANLDTLNRVLKAAAKAHQIPELVIYAIPLRDLGQSSEGGFADYETYLADNRLNAGRIRQFVDATGIRPVIYLEPDSLPLAVQYRRDENNSAEAWRIYEDRIRATQALIDLYQDAGARVYLEAGHGGWFDYGEEDLRRIATALNEAGIARADGLASNVSNRQPVTSERPGAHTELRYLWRLLPLLDKQALDIRVDTSRNGGITHARRYFLHPDGRLFDNEVPEGRLIGRWTQDASDENREIRLQPFFGKPKALSRLLAKEKYTLDAEKRVLTAPAWLDAVGDVKPGPPPTDETPAEVAAVIHAYRYIKPPDDCDGALNCPPGASKHDINAETAKRQPAERDWHPIRW